MYELTYGLAAAGSGGCLRAAGRRMGWQQQGAEWVTYSCLHDGSRMGRRGCGARAAGAGTEARKRASEALRETRDAMTEQRTDHGRERARDAHERWNK
jgi:hypothetical protein